MPVIDDTPAALRVAQTLADGYLQDDNEAGVDEIDVRWTDGTPCADVHGEWVKINADVRDTYGKSVDARTALQILMDTTAHEVEHINQSDLGSKGDVAQANPDMPKTSGMVANILEDAYIDAQRMARNPGQARIHKIKIETLMGNHHRRPRLDTLMDKAGKTQALVECALQVSAAGYGKGLEDMGDTDLPEFAARWHHVVGLAEETDDLDTRLDVIQSGVDLLREYAPDGTSGQDMDDAADDRGGDNLFDDDEAPDLDDLDMTPDDVEDNPDVGDGPDDTPDFDPDDLDDLDDDMDGMGDPGPDPDDAPEPDMDGDDVDDMIDDVIDENDGVEEADPEEMPGPDDTPGPEPQRGPEPDDGPEGEPDDDGAGESGDAPGDADDAPADDPSGDGDGDGGEAGGDAPDDAPAGGDDADTAATDEAGDPDTDGDTARVDALLDEHDPSDLEVVR